MPQRNVATNFTFEQQRQEINLLAADFWTHKTGTDTAAPTYLKHDGSNAFTGQTLAVPNAFTINSNSGNGTVTIAGNLQVDGTTTTVNTATMDVVDKNITIAKGSANDAAADGAGITIDSATDITFNFVDAKDALVSSIGLEATTFIKSTRAQFTGAGNPLTGQGLELTAPDQNTGQIASYDRDNSAYKELRLKGSTVSLYGGTSNALSGTFNSTGLTMGTGKTITSGNITISTTTDASFFINTTNANGAHLRLQTGGTNKTFLGQASGIAGSLGNANDFAIRSAEDIVFSTNNNNTPDVKIDTSGHVGIGDSNPAQLLSLKSADPRILLTETTNNSNCYLDYAAGGILEISVDDNNVDTGSKFQVRIDGAAAGLTLDSTGLDVTGTVTTAGQLTGNSSNSGKYVRMYGSAGTGRWDIYGHGANLRFSDNDSAGNIVFDRNVEANGGITMLSVLKAKAWDTAGGGGSYNSNGLVIGNAYDAGKSTDITDDRNAIIWNERGLDLDFATNDTFRMKLTYDGKLLLGTNTSNSSDCVTFVDPGNAFMSLRSDQHADGVSQFLDFCVGTNNRASGNMVGSIRAQVPTGTTAGGTLQGELSFWSNSGDNISQNMTLHPDGSLTVGTAAKQSGTRLTADGNIKMTQATSNTRRIFALPGTGAYTLNSSGGCAIAFVRDGSNNDSIEFETHEQGASHAVRLTIDKVGNMIPGADDAQDLGSSTKRWANVYTGDMHLNNMNTGGNEVDGSEGHWTMQEGADDLFLINRNTGKKYKFNLTEVS